MVGRNSVELRRNMEIADDENNMVRVPTFVRIPCVLRNRTTDDVANYNINDGHYREPGKNGKRRGARGGAEGNWGRADDGTGYGCQHKNNRRAGRGRNHRTLGRKLGQEQGYTRCRLLYSCAQISRLWSSLLQAAGRFAEQTLRGISETTFKVFALGSTQVPVVAIRSLSIPKRIIRCTYR